MSPAPRKRWSHSKAAVKRRTARSSLPINDKDLLVTPDERDDHESDDEKGLVSTHYHPLTSLSRVSRRHFDYGYEYGPFSLFVHLVTILNTISLFSCAVHFRVCS
jgi:hypothetical protein